MVHREFFGWQQMARIVFSLGWSDFVLKYRGSFLGYLWSFLSPLTRFLVIFYVFGPFVSSSIPHYPLYLFLGIILWEYFAGTTMTCLKVPFEKSDLIHHVRFPRFLLLLVTGWTRLLIFFTHFLIFVLFALSVGIVPSLRHLYVVVVLFQLLLFSIGVGAFLSSFVLRYRDLLHLWDVSLQVLFWLTPIMYRYHLGQPLLMEFLQLPQRLSLFSFASLVDAFVHFQPLSIMLSDARRALLYGESIGVPSWEHAVGLTVVCGLCFIVGVWLFHRRSHFFLEEY